jgi:muconolactone delta-isomerase
MRTWEICMEYLVTMTTNVPEGTAPEEVDGVRAREAANTRVLAEAGKVLRLWRPPLAPGEWRTLGLFAAQDADDLEKTLATMPLRVWRTDEVTPLGPHGNDPGRGRVALDGTDTEFFTTFTLTMPSDASPQDVEAATFGEARRTAELAAQRRLIRLWALPGEGRNLGLWQAADAERMDGILRSLPMDKWLEVETLPLTRHPSDPATA